MEVVTSVFNHFRFNFSGFPSSKSVEKTCLFCLPLCCGKFYGICSRFVSRGRFMVLTEHFVVGSWVMSLDEFPPGAL